MKFYEDEIISNKTFAKIGNLSCDDLLIMESYFLQKINYRILNNPENLEKYKIKITEFSRVFTLEISIQEKNCIESTQIHEVII